MYGGSWPQGMAEGRKETLSDTDEPSLESRVTDNVMVVAIQQFPSSYDGIERALVDFHSGGYKLSLHAKAISSRVGGDSVNKQSPSWRQGDCGLLVDFLIVDVEC